MLACDIECDSAKDVKSQTTSSPFSSFPLSSSPVEGESPCSTDEDVDALVAEDSEEEKDDDVSGFVPKKRLKESVARDPFPLRENLQLGLEEVWIFF